MGIKNHFVPRLDDAVFLEFDYAQLEIRVLAMATLCPQLIADINSGMDMHREFASQIFNKPAQDITADERKLAKGFSFQLQYGAGAPSIAKFWGVDVDLVQQFIDAYYKRYPEVKVWQDNNINTVRNYNIFFQAGNVATTSTNKQIPLHGSRVPSIWPERWGEFYISQTLYDENRSPVFPGTKIKNYPIQGGAADIILLKLNEIRSELLVDQDVIDRLLFINTVHDSFLFEMITGKAGDPTNTEIAIKIKTLLEDVEGTLQGFFPNLNVPVAFPVDVKWGKTWGDMKDLDPYDYI